MNESTILQLFPIPFYISSIDLENQTKESIRNLEYNRFRVDNGWCSSDTYILKKPELEKLHAQILEHVEQYVRKFLHVKDTIKFEITNSWAVKHTTGDWGGQHHHTNSLISGIVYTDTDELSGEITLHKDNGFTNLFPPAISCDFIEYNNLNSKSWKILPKTGQIFLFPSHLDHSVSQSLSDNMRYCVAFNVFPKGSLGLETWEKISTLHLK
jgi:uncharacterized protein (TIGR02466 family)